MEFLEKYKWKKDSGKAGTYTIFKVPIFARHDDGTRKVGEKEAKRILDHFESELKAGYYSRIFIGHHNYISQDKLCENREGAGFIDNLVEEEGVFYCDFAGVPEKIFKEIQQDKYPYRSPEYATKSSKITGLALLESQPPYLMSPILKLEEEEIMVYCTDDIIETFQKGKGMNEEKNNEEPQIQKEKLKEEVPEEYSEVAAEEVAEEEVVKVAEEPKVEEPSPMQEMMQMLKMLVDALITKGGGATSAAEDKQIDIPPSSSISYQAADNKSEIKALQDKVRDLECKQRDEVLNYQLKEICTNKGINYTEQIAMFSSMNNPEIKEKYLASLNNMQIASAIPEHFMSDRAKEGLRLFQASVGLSEGVISKYKNTPDEKNAKKAIQLYQSTMKSGNSERIAVVTGLAKDINKFVEISVLAAKADENYFNNMTMGD